MDEQRVISLVLAALFLGLLLVVWNGHVRLDAAGDRIAQLEVDLTQERQFAEEAFAQNQQLREANGVLRLRIIETMQNLSLAESRVEACFAELPALKSDLVDLVPPQRRVRLDDLLITPDLVVINLANVTPGIIAPSGSMAPLLGEDNIVLETTPRGPSDIFIGDIVVYEHDGVRIIHRIIRMGWDDDGWFAIAQGDNNPREDEWKVRFPDIRGVVVGIIY